MRFLAVVCFFVIAFNYLGSIGGAPDNNIQFSLNGGTSATYSNFLDTLRAKLTQGTKPKHGVPLLNQMEPKSGRFILVDLSDYNARTITVAIDVLNVYVVGYRAVINGTALFYYLSDTDVNTQSFKNLFSDIKGTNRTMLKFNGSYPALARVAGEGRSKIPLGGSPLNSAIGRLLHYDGKNYAPVARSLIVIIQMVSEAARFRFIQTQIGLKIQGDQTYTPGPATLSLENNWSALSYAIQYAQANGQFTTPVEIVNTQNQPFSVKDTTTAIKVTGIALLLYQSAAATSLQLP